MMREGPLFLHLLPGLDSTGCQRTTTFCTALKTVAVQLKDWIWMVLLSELLSWSYKQPCVLLGHFPSPSPRWEWTTFFLPSPHLSLSQWCLTYRRFFHEIVLDLKQKWSRASKGFIIYGSREWHSTELNSHALSNSKIHLAAKISKTVRNRT